MGSISFPNSDIRNIKIGNSPWSSWSDGIVRALDQIEEDYVLLMMEDEFLQKRYDREFFLGLIAKFEEKDMNRLDIERSKNFCSNWVITCVGECGEFTLYKKCNNSSYLMCLTSAIWKKDFLRRCLFPSHSPRELEEEGTVLLREQSVGIDLRLFMIKDTEWWTEVLSNRGGVSNVRYPEWSKLKK